MLLAMVFKRTVRHSETEKPVGEGEKRGHTLEHLKMGLLLFSRLLLPLWTHNYTFLQNLNVDFKETHKKKLLQFYCYNFKKDSVIRAVE